MRLAVLASHPIQYEAPLFRRLARQYELTVFFAHRTTAADQSKAGFGVGFDWDVDLLTGYAYEFLDNVASQPGLDHFGGCDTPSIGNKLREGNYKALLVMGWYLKCFVQGIWSAKRLGLPVIVRGDSHLETPRSAAKRAAKAIIYPLALRSFDAGLYVGERSRSYWEHYGYPRHRLFFSPHCVDKHWFAQRATEEARRNLRERHGISPQAKVVLFAGKLVPFKRPLDLIEAASSLLPRMPDLTVLIAGAGMLSDSINTLAAMNKFQLVNLGFCNQTEMPAVYAAADVLVLPSSGQETWGLVANEALACGRPIIVSDVCGCALDLAADGTAGRIFPMGNVAALANTIAELLDNPPETEAIVAKASDYSLEKAVQGISDALNMIFARRRIASS